MSEAKPRMCLQEFLRRSETKICVRASWGTMLRIVNRVSVCCCSDPKEGSRGFGNLSCSLQNAQTLNLMGYGLSFGPCPTLAGF